MKLRLTDAKKTKEDATTEDIFLTSHKSNTIDFYDNDVSLQLHLSTNHLSNPKLRQYSYRIPGLQDDWKTQSTNVINLNRFPYGDFSLELIADLNKPAYKSDILTIQIHTHKPFKKTIAAYILGTIGLSIILWLIVQKYLENIRARNLNLEREIAERTQDLRDSNNTKNKLFTILAHDLRNPIASLTDMTDKIKFLVKKNRVDELEILAEDTKGKISALDDNLNNILLWALSENKMMTFNPQKLSLKLEIKKILELYSSQIQSKNIQSDIRLDIVDQVTVDITVLQTILRNVISNAIKFSFPDYSRQVGLFYMSLTMG